MRINLFVLLTLVYAFGSFILAERLFADKTTSTLASSTVQGQSCAWNDPCPWCPTCEAVGVSASSSPNTQNCGGPECDGGTAEVPNVSYGGVGRDSIEQI